MDKTLLALEFINDEENAFLGWVQGGFYPLHHHQITPMMKKLPYGLDDREAVLLYYHLMRLGHVIHPGTSKQYVFLQQAFQELLPVMEEHYPRNCFNKLEGAFLFGALEANDAEKVTATTYTDYMRYREVIVQCNKYSSLPNMRKKKTLFQAYAQDPEIVQRVISALEHIQFVHNCPLVSDATFWGFIFILVLSKTAASQHCLYRFTDTARVLPDKRSHIWILTSFLKNLQDPEQQELIDRLYTLYPAAWMDESE